MRFWNYREKVGWHAFFLNTAGNVAAFVPFGFFLPVVLGKRCGLFVALLTGCQFSLAVEMTQFCTRTGSFDVDDILLNTLGAGIGYLLFLICYHALPPEEGDAE